MTSKFTSLVRLSSLLVLAAVASRGADGLPLSEADLAKALDTRLHFQTNEVTLPGKLAKLSLTPAFRYLSPGDAEFVLTKLWGNPPGAKTLGMIFPSGLSPASEDTWGIVITYADDGYIKDSDADSINYDDLLKKMQAGARQMNEERAKKGFPTVDLVGWAARPRYDKQAHKMYWAKELKFADSKANTLNYNIRVLGRGGVLNLNVVSSMEALPRIEASAPEIVGLVNFTEGNRYADFKPGTDKVAAYGLAALVAGGIAAKAGFFKVILVALLAAKKFIIIGLIALFALFKKFYSGRSRADT
jgi:uncharacterized membrane-anchored protein